MADAIERVRAHWARRVGAPPECFRDTGTHAVITPQQRAERVILFRAPQSTLVALPPTAQADAALATLHAARGRLLDAGDVAALLPAWSLTHLYRDYILGLPADQAPSVDHPQVHALDASDAAALDELFAACDERERRLALIGIGDPFVMGYWQGKRLLGAASLLLPDAAIADIGILVRPQARRRGVATALVRQVARLAAGMGKTVQYCTQDDNLGSLAVARRCGFALALVEDGLRTEGTTPVET